MDNQKMCFVVVYKDNNLIRFGMRNDDGVSTYKAAEEKGYSVRKWEMYGLSHGSELDVKTKNEIKSFINSLKH